MHGHGGTHAIAAAAARGARTLFTLSGAHIFPLYDAAVGGADTVRTAAPEAVLHSGPMRLVDVRHEQTAVFAAEATGRLTRTPGFAALTAGPGVTNGISAITGAMFNGSPLVVLGGRAPQARWGSGALQELDHPPILRSITKDAFTIASVEEIGVGIDRAFALAATAHRGPVFADIPIDVIFSWGDAPAPAVEPVSAVQPDPEAIDAARALLREAQRPVLIIGSDVWQGGAEHAAQALVQAWGLPAISNGMGRGVIPRGDHLLVSRARGHALSNADLVLVAGTPLDFRLGYGVFGDPPAAVVHLVDAPAASPETVAVQIVGDLAASLGALAHNAGRVPAQWSQDLRDRVLAAEAADEALLAADTDPIHPARIYGELLPRLTDDSIVIGDGGDFVSFAGKFIEPARPGRWLDPGPYGCLGTGPGYAMAARIAHPQSPVFLLLGDGAAGFSLMDVDSLVRHRLPVVIIVGNNSGWALEKHPMRFLYGYDVIADLAPTRYDEIVRALGGAGETVTRPEGIGPAIDRAMAAGVPYLVNVMTDPAVAYPRSTTGV